MYQYDNWYMSLRVGDRLVCRFGRNVQTCIPDGHLHGVTYTSCRIGTIDSPDDEHGVARNMYRTEININEKELCVRFVTYKNYTEMRRQQTIIFE